MIIAGTDTSSVTMFYMLKACEDDQSLEECLREEVDTHIGETRSSLGMYTYMYAMSKQRICTCTPFVKV